LVIGKKKSFNLELENLLFVLVHDGWHGAWAWDDLIERLAQRGSAAVALDLPGHGKLYRADEGAGDYSLAKYASAVEQFVRHYQRPGQKIVLVGHGIAGPVLQLAAQNLTTELTGLIFLGGYVLRNGESIISQMPPEMAAVFEQLAESRSDKRIALDELVDYWRFNVINDDVRRADEILTQLKPEPAAPLFEPIVLKHDQSALPSAYVSFNEDMSLPPGEFHPRMASKLGKHRHITVNAGHEGPLTKPREVAEALIFLGLHGLG